MFLTIYMHQFGWLSERGGGKFSFRERGYFASERRGTQKGEVFPQKKGGGGFQPWRKLCLMVTHLGIWCTVYMIFMICKHSTFSLYLYLYQSVHPPLSAEGGLLVKRGWLFSEEGCNFHIKNKLKSGIFNDKKRLQAKIFFSVITTNSNWEILPKNLVTFKR